MDGCFRFHPRTSNPGSGPRLQAHADSGRAADVHALRHSSRHYYRRKKEKDQRTRCGKKSTASSGSKRGLESPSGKGSRPSLRSAQESTRQHGSTATGLAARVRAPNSYPSSLQLPGQDSRSRISTRPGQDTGHRTGTPAAGCRLQTQKMLDAREDCRAGNSEGES